MKKVLLATLIVMLLFVAACSIIPTNNGEPNNNEDSGNLDNGASLKIEDYFPIKDNLQIVYEGQGNEFASYNITIDYTSENKVQQRNSLMPAGLLKETQPGDLADLDAYLRGL